MSIQLIPVTQRKARRFTPQQKLQILKEWELTGNGVEVASVVILTLLYNWHIFPKFVRPVRSIQKPGGFGCDCLDNL